MHMITLAALVIETDDALAVSNIDHAILETVRGRGNGFRHLPDDKLDDAAVCFNVFVLGDFLRIHVG